MQHKLLQYLLAGLCIVLLFYSLPILGKSLRGFRIRLIAFSNNIYHAQSNGKQIEQLRNENATLQQQLVALDEYKKENEFLRSALNVQKDLGQRRLLLAYVIGQGAFVSQDTIMIDKGITDGIKGGELLIVSPNILVGKISSVFAHYAVASLLFNVQSRIPAITTQESKGIVRGDVGHQVLLDEVTQSATLHEGDMVITDNQTSSIPGHLLIGKIAKIISKPTDLVKRAQLEMSIDISALDRVFIILPI